MPKKKEVEVLDVKVIEAAQGKSMMEYTPRYNSYVADAKGLKVVDEVTMSKAVSLRDNLKGLGDQIKTFRDGLYKPIKDHIKKMEAPLLAYEKTIKEAIGDWRTGLSGELSRYETQQAEARRIEEDKLRAEQQKQYEKDLKKAEKKGVVPPPPPPPAVVEAPKNDEIGFSSKWVFDVVAEKDVPREWLQLNEKQINAAISNGRREIPGLLIYEVKIPRTKSMSIEDL